MNKIPATVLSVQNSDILNIVTFGFEKYKMSMMSLEVESLEIGDRVLLTAKPSSVAIGKDFNGTLSYSNQLKGKIKTIQNGDLLTSLEVLVGDVEISSVITKNSSSRMDLKKGDEVICIVKASDLSILEILK